MTQKHFTVKKLNSQNLNDVLALQEKIVAGLHPDEQHFLLKRTAADYMRYLNGKSSNMLGVFDGDNLIAQVVYQTPENGEPRDMPEFKPDVSNANLVIYEAILVAPEYRGSGLMKRMLEYIETNSLDEGRKYSIIQIAIDNPASWINALHHGMSITKVDRDPSDGVKVIYLEKKIHQPQNTVVYNPEKSYNLVLGNDIHRRIPHLFMKMQHLISRGYHGIRLNKETKSLVWLQKEDLTQTMDMNFILAAKKKNAYSSL